TSVQVFFVRPTTSQAQRPGPRGRWIATWTRWPGSLQRMVRPRNVITQIVSPCATLLLDALVLDCLFFFDGPLPIHSRIPSQPLGIILIARSLASRLKLVCGGCEYL